MKRKFLWILRILSIIYKILIYVNEFLCIDLFIKWFKYWIIELGLFLWFFNLVVCFCYFFMNLVVNFFFCLKIFRGGNIMFFFDY